jgi:hypothetical protein
MCELRKLFLLIDTYDIKRRTLYIRSAANLWVDNLSRITDNSDRQLAPRKSKYFDKRWGAHSIDRFASYANKQLSRYNAKWRDGTAEVVDSLHMPDAEWRKGKNWCNSPPP